MAKESAHFDEQAFILNLYKQYRQLMNNIVKKYISDYNVVEDLIQDALVNLIPKTSTLRKLDENALSAYIAVTVKNVIKNYIKREKTINKHRADNEFNECVDIEQRHELTPEEILLINERIGEFNKVFKKLSDLDQDVLMGKYILDLTDQEIGDLTGYKPNSIRMVLTRARRKALEIMKETFSYD